MQVNCTFAGLGRPPIVSKLSGDRVHGTGVAYLPWSCREETGKHCPDTLGLMVGPDMSGSTVGVTLGADLGHPTSARLANHPVCRLYHGCLPKLLAMRRSL